ncbi:MAG: hypothetical protein ACLFUH_00425 [Bacteroidales bacterium]
MTTSIKDDLVPKFRRAIDDEEEPYMYEDTALAEYLQDAIEQLSIEWDHGYKVDRDNNTVEPDIEPAHQMFFVMKAKFEMLTRRPDISFSTGGLSVTRKSDNKKILGEKIDEIINILVALEYVGSSNSELDKYAKRWENWLYIQNL